MTDIQYASAKQRWMIGGVIFSSPDPEAVKMAATIKDWAAGSMNAQKEFCSSHLQFLPKATASLIIGHLLAKRYTEAWALITETLKR